MHVENIELHVSERYTTLTGILSFRNDPAQVLSLTRREYTIYIISIHTKVKNVTIN